MGSKFKTLALMLILIGLTSFTRSENTFAVNTITSLDTLPSSIDNSQTLWFPPIALQNHGCTAFSVGYYIKTFQEAKEHNWDLSGAKWEGVTRTNGVITDFGHPTPSYQKEIMSPAFLFNLDEPSGSIESEINLVSNIGVSTWATMPYDGNSWTDWASEQAWAEAPLYRANSTTGYQYINLSNEQGINSLKSLLASQNLASIYINASALTSANLTPQDFLTTNNYNLTTASSTNHVNTIVGYDDSVSYTENGAIQYGAFKVANSYGVGTYKWENIPDGFYWISYAAMQQRIKTCLFFNDLIAYKPTLTASFQINATKRSDYSIVLSAGSVSKPFSSFVSSYPYPYSKSDYLPFPNNKITIDISEFQNQLHNIVNQTFVLSITNSGDTSATISEFSIRSPQGYQECLSVPYIASSHTLSTLSINYTNPNPFPTATPTTSPTVIPQTPLPTSTNSIKPTPEQTQTPTPLETASPTTTPTASTSANPSPTLPIPTHHSGLVPENFLVIVPITLIVIIALLAVIVLVLRHRKIS